MDYGTVSNGPDFDNSEPTQLAKLRAFFDNLGVTRPPTTSVRGLVGLALAPVGDLYIGAHSNREGVVIVQMFESQTPDENNKFFSDYETVDQALERPGDSIAIEPSTLGPDPHFVHFKGCNLGQAVPFLQHWKAAFESKAPGRIQVTAPKYNHGLVIDEESKKLGTGGNRGLWEFMLYEFSVTSPVPVANRALLIQLFQSQQFKFLETLNGSVLADGPPVPDENWTSWLPKKLKRRQLKDGSLVLLDKDQKQYRSFDVQPFGAPRGTFQVNEAFTVEVNVFNRTIIYPSGATVPDNNHKTDQLEDLKTSLLSDVENINLGRPSRFRKADNHPYPMYARYGYEGVDTFRDGFDWKFTPGAQELVCHGTRRKYTQYVGVTAPNPGPQSFLSQLLTNFHPFKPIYAPVTQLPVTDPRFFKTV